MRIRRVTILEFHRVFDRPLWNPATVWRERRAPLLRLESDDGTIGLGEAWCRQDEIRYSFAALHRLAAALPGRDLDDLRHAPASSRHDWVEAGAASAIDMALWDMAARRDGRPLASFLGPTTTVAAYASGGLYGPDKDVSALAREMAGYAAAGFAGVKMKIGGLDAAADLDRVAAVRAATGGALLIVDGVERYDLATAARLAGALADRGVAAFQAPLPAADIDGLAALARQSPIPLVLGEAEFDHGRLVNLVTSGAAGWLQANPGLAGGPTGMAHLARIARDHGVPLSPQAHATAVLQATALHCGALHGVGWVEHHQVHDHLAGLLPPSLRRPTDGRIVIPPLPGLGFDLPSDGSLRTVFRLPD
ncbi:L-alanine-DL-glutamate epimerase-like enolase superfamily enzyme [Stella humosa]|uniref:L-alanine-DL-glutamate epimerase-like enolase superfamily enzyme n=1 Tax=Stella humosa TaxID=94 RepID=A0A3N1MEZ4_9PROT|nr:enolase C-terminal domain-like protein [Stella humosa]ROQ01280.1 L-alanine-DL-glutamate epimerase-like enolase superfamily enzyme [Stella humosa]BBK31654.1 D-galactarolactone cycloisomerase [Stella humosa]